jgi:hypothetical protein
MAATIRSEARLEDGTIFVREAVALLRPTPRKPVTFLALARSHAFERDRGAAAETAPQGAAK